MSERSNRLNKIIGTGHILPEIKYGTTLGLLGDQNLSFPEGYEVIGSVKDSSFIPVHTFSAKEFGLDTTQELRVIGRTGSDFLLSIRDLGEPVFLVPKGVLRDMKFAEEKFNWDPIEDEA